MLHKRKNNDYKIIIVVNASVRYEASVVHNYKWRR